MTNFTFVNIRLLILQQYNVRNYIAKQYYTRLFMCGISITYFPVIRISNSILTYCTDIFA